MTKGAEGEPQRRQTQHTGTGTSAMQPQEMEAIGEAVYGRWGWQTKLAKEAGVDGSTVRRWKSGAVEIPSHRADKIRAIYADWKGGARRQAAVSSERSLRVLKLLADVQALDRRLKASNLGAAEASIVDEGEIRVTVGYRLDGTSEERSFLLVESQGFEGIDEAEIAFGLVKSG